MALMRCAKMKVWPNDQMIKYDRFKDRTPLGMRNLRKKSNYKYLKSRVSTKNYKFMEFVII